MLANNRVLFFLNNSVAATVVYGQSNMASAYYGEGASRLGYPMGVTLDAAGNLYVADSENSRVLQFPDGPSAAAQTTATVVYGQADLQSSAPNQGSSTPSASSLNSPAGVALDLSGNLFIGDNGNNRVLYFPPGQLSGTQVATRVYGHSY